MSNAPEPSGTLATALAYTRRLLQLNPSLAREQVAEILKAAPGHPEALLLQGTALRLVGDVQAAARILRLLAAQQPQSAAVHAELGTVLAELGDVPVAIHALRRAVALKPALPDAWRTLGDLLRFGGDSAGADVAFAQHIRASTQDPRLLEPASALVEGRIAEAETLLRKHLIQFPTDVAALRMLAEVAARLGRNADAEVLLSRCLELSPSFTAARHQYAIVLQRQNRFEAALREIDTLLRLEPRSATYANLRAVVLNKIGNYDESLALYARVLQVNPHAKIWMSYGHTLATAGRFAESIRAYREAISRAAELGEAYWSLANLKTFRFEEGDIEAMRRQLARTDLTDTDRFHFDFALGKALEDRCEFAQAAQNYLQANLLRRAAIDYVADETSAFVNRCKGLFTPEFMLERGGAGAPDQDPIFILGMPRAGSTLIEQILASHSQVEGTMELPDIIMMAATLAGPRRPDAGPRYPAVLAGLKPQEWYALGQQYLEQTRIQRKSGKPLFIDKMPGNFLHTGMIALALPNAKIIDARRHPMACGFSNFKQQFAEGNWFSYDLTEIGRYYRDYVELMQHFDLVAPGRVYRVIYERLVADPEAEVRRLLNYCKLPFEESCLRFYENSRPVRTASSQQVRQPIFREGLEHWRHFEPWLEPLRAALGDVLDVYPVIRT